MNEQPAQRTQHMTPESTASARQPPTDLSGVAFAVVCTGLILLAGYFLWSAATMSTERDASLIGPAKPATAKPAISGVNANTRVEATKEAIGAPKLVADREKIDLGDIPLGKTVKVDFQLTNAGDQPLQIKEQPYLEVIQGCCPPEPAIGAMTLSPGQTTQLSMQFMMHEGMGGQHLFRIHVKSNDPQQPERTLDVASNWVS